MPHSLHFSYLICGKCHRVRVEAVPSRLDIARVIMLFYVVNCKNKESSYAINDPYVHIYLKEGAVGARFCQIYRSR